ncbi:Cinnamoyl-CoA reductase 1 [Nymphaea thermarum]|nr:Cinnamoyl-CoA reductase 1 [Nymphaea thermarum]
MGKVVCVTGASGYIASWLVKLLLERGYTVRATVRDPDDPKKTEHLRALEGASERLHLFKADLLDEGAFDYAVSGCEGVFHTASPFFNETQDPQAELLDPAVKGTVNVLRSCAKIPSIRRVVVTSSMAAVAVGRRARTPDAVVDETWFSDADFCREIKSWYVLSKTLAEEQAWKFAEEAKMDVVTINPAMVIGPLLQPTLNTSAAAILKLIDGSPTFPNTTFGWVHVKDVAEAHILAFEDASANGRYCLVESVAHFSEIVKILQDLYPDYKLPTKCADAQPLSPTYQVSKEKVEKLGINYIPLQVSLKETVESLKEKKFLGTRGRETERMDKVVCVTGGSGYVASWVVNLLLERGYTVRATVRDPDDPKKVEHLLALEGASERLHLFKADLHEEGAFDPAVNGCEGVFHIATPCPSYEELMQLWYHIGKTLADKEVLKFAEENKMDIVSMYPGIVIGPLLQPNLNASSSLILNFVNGSPTYANVTFGFVNVKDVGMAHILAFEDASASRRYCLVDKVHHYSEVVEILRGLYPYYKLPAKCADDKPFLPTYQVSKEKAQKLGIDFIPFERRERQ